MNDLHRAVLLRHGTDLVRDMIPTETLLGAMFQRRIFEEEMIELIRACRIPSEQIYKILELLPKRGPEAFERFLEILQEQYPWLAKLIQDSLIVESERLQAALAKKDDTLLLIDNTRGRSATPRGDRLDGDIKSRVSAFVQKQFGQVRKISMSEKKSIERWMSEWLHNERKTLRKAFDEANPEASEADILEHPDVKEKLFSLYTYINTKHKKDLKKKKATKSENDADKENMEEDVTVDEVNFDILWREVNEMITKYEFMEKQINRCYVYMGVGSKEREHEKDIANLVNKLCAEFRYKEKELVKERQKIEQILVELYQYSTKTNKLENILNNQELEIVELKAQINKYRSENVEMIQEINSLKRANLVHLEKEKTLEDLKQAKEDLHTMLTILNKENKELKERAQGSKGTFKAGVTGSRRNNVNTNTMSNNNRMISPRKPAPKKQRSNSFKT